MMASVKERAGVVKDAATGEMIIPASQRPDGTWRKPRRVKDGYIPQEEVPVWETKGTQFVKNRPDHPIGLCKEDVEKIKKVKEAHIEANTNAAVRARSAKQKVKEKSQPKTKSKGEQKAAAKTEKTVESVSKGMAKVDLSTCKKPPAELSQEDIAKKVRNSKKKLRQIEELEAKIASGDIKEPNKEQLDKIEKKQGVLDEIRELESKLQ